MTQYPIVIYVNLWQIGREINGTVLKILKEYYTDNIAYVKIGNELSDPI